MAKYNGSGWHFQSIRHSNARKYGKAGGTYAVYKKDKYGLNAEKIGEFNNKAPLVFSTKKYNIIPISTKKIDNAYNFILTKTPRWAKKYATKNPKETDLTYFEHITPAEAKALYNSKDTKLDPEEYQNNSPKAKLLIKIAEEENGRVGGYIVPKENGREDARITLETLYIPDENKANQLKARYKPDEFGKEGKYWRLWWD